jgi:hypothetical protein
VDRGKRNGQSQRSKNCLTGSDYPQPSPDSDSSNFCFSVPQTLKPALFGAVTSNTHTDSIAEYHLCVGREAVNHHWNAKHSLRVQPPPGQSISPSPRCQSRHKRWHSDLWHSQARREPLDSLRPGPIFTVAACGSLHRGSTPQPPVVGSRNGAMLRRFGI